MSPLMNAEVDGRRTSRTSRTSPCNSLREFTGQLSKLGKRRQWQRALELLLAESNGRCRLDVVAFSAVAGACARANAWRGAVATLHGMEDQQKPESCRDIVSRKPGVLASLKT